MPTPRQVSLRFPIGGVVRRHAFQTQQPFTTPDALNIWPTDHDSGRERGGVRPGISTSEIDSGNFGNPRSWCFATWLDTSNNLHEGVAVCTSSGVYTYDGSWTRQITGGSSFTDACVYRNVLIQANGGGTVTVENLGNAASGANFHGDGNLTTRVQQWVAADPLDEEGNATRFGVAPENCGICIAWMDRVWFAGDTTNPQVLYASAVGNYLNYDYSDVTKGGAYTTSGSDGGVISGRITSLIDHGSNCMLVGARDEMYVVRDNPRGGGYQLNIARHVGPLSQTAWCKDENNRTWFLSRKGLHVIPSGCGQPPEQVSGSVIPNDLVGIDPGSNATASLGYDLRYDGIHIYVLDGPNGDRYWFYDLKSGGFWPMSFGSRMRMAVPFRQTLSQDRSALVAITTGGHAGQFDRTTADSEPSYVWYGPIQLGGPMEQGAILTISATLDAPEQTVSENLSSSEGQVMWQVHVGDSAVQAYENSAAETGAFDLNGWNYPCVVRRSGNAAYIKLSSVSDKRWVLEEVVLETVAAGKRRVWAQEAS